MPLIFFFLTSIFLSLLQLTFLPFNLLLVVVIWEGLMGEDFLIKSFMAGLIFDLIFGLHPGVSSAAFLIISFLSHLYSGKFSRFHFVFLLIILLFSIVIFNLLTKGIIFNKADWWLVLFFVVFGFVKKFSDTKEFEIKLKL